ncbi:MAG TPA: PLP-dependent aminotransferase family protein [Allosphingosinicella sp.]|nr:PLP-dependent aminotransferase family protein [Allosphingosinicella sp.]
MAWRPDFSADGKPFYLAIADALAADMKAGRVQPGEKLPTQRDLAETLGLDLTTITRAYAEAARRGLIAGEGRRGSFVRGRPAEAETGLAGGAAASGMNMPPEPEDGSLRRAMSDGIAALLDGRLAPLHYQPPGGLEAQRAAAAAFLAPLVPDTGADQVAITAGSQHGLHALLSLLLERGDRIAAPAFTYPGFLAAARRLGAEVVPLAMDAEGLLPDALEQAARAAALKAVYLVPTNDNPTAATLPLERRKEIARIALRHNVAIVEDDAYGRFPASPPPPLAALAPKLTWHIASLSKTVSPSLRVGFVRAPGVREAHALAAAAHESAVMAPPLNVALVTNWILDGTLNRLTAAVRHEAAARMKEAAAILGPAGAHFHPEGYHLWLRLPAGADAGRIAAQAIAAGLPAAPGAAFAAVPGQPVQALRISLGGSAPRIRIAREIRRLDALLAQAGSALV